ncbi:hypothetical protein [Gordonia westfalica]|nr:hypothetical protein [Gordonia westfalica]
MSRPSRNSTAVARRHTCAWNPAVSVRAKISAVPVPWLASRSSHRHTLE